MANINGWYWGNLLFLAPTLLAIPAIILPAGGVILSIISIAGLIGELAGTITDASTDAIYKYPDKIIIELEKKVKKGKEKEEEENS